MRISMKISLSKIFAVLGVLSFIAFVFYMNTLVKTYNETGEITSVFFHKNDKYTIMYLENNEVKTKELIGLENRPLRVIADVPEDMPMWYKISYSTKGNVPQHIDDTSKYVYEIHIRNTNDLLGGEFKIGKNGSGQTVRITHH
jgi:hypothetical protein